VHCRGVEAGARWLAELHGFDARQILDLLYIEVRLGCWAGPQMIAKGPCAFRIAPFNQRAIFERALDIPFELRCRDYLPAAIVRRERPDLANFAYNAGSRTLHKRLGALLGRALWKRAAPARSLAHKLVQLMAGAPNRDKHGPPSASA
jgi:hypothetical protein